MNYRKCEVGWMNARKNPVLLVCAALKYEESHNNVMSEWDVMKPALLNIFSLLFQVRGKCLSITIVYYACAAKWTCIHRTPWTFFFSPAWARRWKTSANHHYQLHHRRVFLTAAQATVCSRVSQPVTIIGWAADVLGSICCPVKKKKRKKIHLPFFPFSFLY